MTDHDITKEEFCRRFKARILSRCAPRTHFDDGYSISIYADETATIYWDEEDWNVGEGPEACADADMSYWEE